METYRERYERWLGEPAVDEATKTELRAMEGDEEAIRERFTSYLSFGTAGLRGTMVAGTAAMNVYTVTHATQGFADYILSHGEEAARRGIVIAYDSRLNSALFAQKAAAVMAANGVKTFLFDALRPTPELSFAVRELRCIAGVNITASHNPQEYNGYKAYWEDGAQLAPEQAEAVSARIAEVDLFSGVKCCEYADAIADGRITVIGEDFDERYMAAVMEQRVNADTVAKAADSLKIVYTPLHGAGCRLIPEVLRRCGLRYLYTVEEQMTPDGTFPTAKKPNPEYAEVYALGIQLAEEVQSDLIIATDPDADRTGIMVRGGDGFVTLTGNQVGALLLDYIITALEETNSVPPEPYVIKTIVTTEIITEICAAHDLTLHNVLTGFKFIGEVIKKYENAGHGSFLFGFEESYGYLKGSYARDKDAVVASMLITEMAAYYMAKGMTLYDALEALYRRYGIFLEATDNIYMEGLDGLANMKKLMERLRGCPPAAIGGERVVCVRDYLTGTVSDLETGAVSSTELPSSDVLYYETEKRNVAVIRPSGTEPKIKVYYLLRGDSWEAAAQTLEQYKRTAKEWL